MEGNHVNGPAKILISIARHGREEARRITMGDYLEITPVIYSRGGSMPDMLIEGLAANGIPYEMLHEKWRFDTSIVGQLRRIVDKLQPDVLESHMVKSHFFVRFSGLRRTHRWIAFHHGYTKVDLKVEIYNQFDRWSLSQARRVITVCDYFAGQLIRQGIPRERIGVQHNSVPPFQPPAEAEVQALRAAHGLTGNQPVLLAVGRLSPEKGFGDLLDAAAILRARDPNFRLLIMGEGQQRAHLESLIQRHGLTRHVIMPGYAGNMAAYYALASILVISSHSEGSPNMLLEAMAAGLPVVTTSAGGIPEMVTSGKDALIVPVRNSLRLAGAIGELLNDRSLARRLGEAGLESARSRYTIAAHYASLLRMYQGLIKQDARQ